LAVDDPFTKCPAVSCPATVIAPVAQEPVGAEPPAITCPVTVDEPELITPESAMDDGVMAPSVMLSAPDPDTEPETPFAVVTELTNAAQVVVPLPDMVVTAFPELHALAPPNAANCPAVEEATCRVPDEPTELVLLAEAALMVIEWVEVEMVMFVPAKMEYVPVPLLSDAMPLLPPRHVPETSFPVASVARQFCPKRLSSMMSPSTSRAALTLVVPIPMLPVEGSIYIDEVAVSAVPDASQSGT